MTLVLTYWNGNKRTIKVRCFEWTRMTGYLEFMAPVGSIRYGTDHVRCIEVL
jgi:hypothetical protein